MARILVWMARILFVALMIGLSVIALSGPESDANIGDFIPWDKASHFIAYFTLGLIGMAAFERLPIFVLLVLLLAQGTLIEALQPYFGRSRDIGDLLANCAGLAGVFAPLLAYRLREWFQERPLKVLLYKQDK